MAVAGSETTVALSLARLGHHVAWIGRIGADELGLLVQGTLRGEGVTPHVVVDAQAPTGLMLREQCTADRYRVHYYRRGSAGSRLAPQDIPVGLVESGRILHVGAITPALSASASDAVDSALRRARGASVMVSFDACYRAHLWSAGAFIRYVATRLPLIDLMFVSLDDARLLLGAAEDTSPLAAARALTERGSCTVVVTTGKRGAASCGLDGEAEVAAIPGIGIDPVAAPDSFIAGYLSEMLGSSSPAARLARAVDLARVTHR